MKYDKTFTNITFPTFEEIEEYIKICELRHLDLDDEEVWSKVYLPASRGTDKPGVYEGHVEFWHIHTKLVSPNESLMGCGPLPDWLCEKRCIYAIDNMNDNLCVWRCLLIAVRISMEQTRPKEHMTRDTLVLVREFYDQPALQVGDVRPTKLIAFEKIASKFKVNIRLYKPVNYLTWKLVFLGKTSSECLIPMLTLACMKDTASSSKT